MKRQMRGRLSKELRLLEPATTSARAGNSARADVK